MTDTTRTRFMKAALTWAIKLYPCEKRVWGEAILSEADSVSEFNAVLSWTIGGIVVAFRAFFSRLFRRSAVKGELAPIGPAQIPPPIPWKLALVCLTITGALLFVPDLRQALSVTFSSWRSEFLPPDESVMWHKLGREAESKGDAAAMAFVAMHLPDGNGARFDEAVSLAQHAVAKDPSLTWTYYFLAERREDNRFRGSIHAELTQHLQEWDPKNAVAYLAEADEIQHTHYDDPQWGFLPIDSDKPIQQEVLARLRGRNPRWLDLMGRAFAAPTYDSYFDRRLDLDLRVMQRLGIMDPQRAVTAYIADNQLPNLRNMREYAALRLAQGEAAERAGKWEDAADEYWAVAQFGQRVCLGGKADIEIELIIARGLQEAAFKRLQSVLYKLGRAQEAQNVGYEAQLQRAANDEVGTHSRSETRRLLTFSLASGLLVHFCAIVFEASVLLMAVVLLTLTLRRAPRFVRLGLTYAPLLLVLGCAGLLCAYHPYAEYYRSYLANPSAQDHESILNVLIVSGVPRYAFSGNLGAQGPVYLWWAVLAVAGAICICLLSRTLRHRHI